MYPSLLTLRRCRAIRVPKLEDDHPLAGRVAVVTGVELTVGIGFAIARDLLASGMTVLIQSWGSP